MDADEHNAECRFEIGDIVTETDYIVEPNRQPWVGIVVYIESDYYELHSYLGQYEDLIGVYWFKEGHVECLPASVIHMVQKAKKNKK
tara:strand:- start:38 stop:298 length:261 start_codon:yes stop_codon:yes gene_type:complete